MAGGFFDTDGANDSSSVVVSAGTPADTSDQVTSELSPGGLFQTEGASVQASASASASSSSAEEYAEDARGWAVGNDTEALDDWSETNNAKYYAEQAEDDKDDAQAAATDAANSATDAATSATQAENAKNDAEDARDAAQVAEAAAMASAASADSDATRADSDAAAAAASATAAAASAASADSDAIRADSDAAAANASATAAAASATAAAASATSADSDATAAAASAASADSDRILAAASATAADSDATLAQSWAEGGTGTRNGEDTDNAEYWAGQAASSAASIHGVDKGAQGYGIFIDTDGTENTINVDTDKIVDTDYLEANTLNNASVSEDGQTLTITKGDSTTVTFDNTSPFIDINTTDDSLIARSDGNDGISIGANSRASGEGSVAIGGDSVDSIDAAIASGSNSLALGNISDATGVFSLAMFGDATDTETIAIGRSATADASRAIAIGSRADADGENSIAIGGSSSDDDSADVTSAGDNGIAIGRNTQSSHTNSVAIGRDAETSAAGQFVFGSSLHTAFRSPGLTGGDNYFMGVDSNGNWSTAVVSGGDTPPAHVSVDVSFDTSAVVVQDAVNRTATVTVTNGTFTSITNEQTSQGTVTDSDNTVDLVVAEATEGTIRVSFIVNYTDSSNVAHSHTEHFSITVRANWRAGVSASEPDGFSDLPLIGAFVEGSSVTLDNTEGTQAIGAYAFIPTADLAAAEFETTKGFEVPFTQLDLNLGDHTLITWGTVEPGDTNVIDVAEV